MMRRGPKTGARAGLVLCHGRGGSAADILSLLDHAGLPDVAAIAPEAPGHSWWPTSFLAPMAAMETPLRSGLQATAAAIAALEADGISRERIWLGGFSQGACLAAESYARLGAGLAGAFVLSGGLVGSHDAGGAAQADLAGHGAKRFDYDTVLSGRVWLSVHEQDPHIPLRRTAETQEVLSARGAQVERRVYPGAGHGVMAPDVATLRAWLS